MTATTEIDAAVGSELAVTHDALDDAAMYCYRHPDRETRVRCGRCDRPICTRCAMQGPVGFRCRQCGTLAFDPLTSLTPSQIALGFLVSGGLAGVAGFLASYVGVFGILISFFGGGLIAEAATRVIGFKRGPVMIGVVLGGIVVGTLIGYGAEYAYYVAQFPELIDPEIAAEVGLSPMSFFADWLIWALVSVGAACVGAYSRLR